MLKWSEEAPSIAMKVHRILEKIDKKNTVCRKRNADDTLERNHLNELGNTSNTGKDGNKASCEELKRINKECIEVKNSDIVNEKAFLKLIDVLKKDIIRITHQAHSIVSDEDTKTIEDNAKKKHNVVQHDDLPKILEQDAVPSNR